MKRLIIIAPNDRYNYGDLLFSHIIKCQLQNCYDEIVDVATIDNDLTKVGGFRVKALEYVYSLPASDENDIIIAGGESLCSNWGICLSYLSSFFAFIPILERVFLKFFSPGVVDNIKNFVGRILFNGKTYYPYSIGKNEIPNVHRIIYNSLGGATLQLSNFTKKTIQVLRSVDYISVRDGNAYNLLQQEKIKAFLVPDSAILLSDYYSDENLMSKIDSKVKAFVQKEKSYLVFQVNKSIGLSHLQEISRLLENIHFTLGLNICLCPIGFARGHDDPIALKTIMTKLSADYISYLSDVSIWDIMYLIKKSKCFVGTSLHGVITSMSFGIPFVGIKVQKTIDYIKLWGGNELNYSYSFMVVEKIKTLLDTNYSFDSTSMKQLSRESFSKIKVVLCK